MATKSIDLSQLFGAVANTLVQNQSNLNEADTYNHDHGDNMVQIFETITQAMKEKGNATPAEQLAYASQLLSAKTQSGSAKVYAEGLSDAAKKFQGKTAVTPNNATTLIQALLGTQNKIPATLPVKPQARPQASAGGGLLDTLLGGLTGETQQSQPQASAGGDLLGTLLGGLTGETQQAQPQASAGGDLLGTLLGGLSGATGTSAKPSSSGQLDINKILKMGLSYMQAKQQGSSDLNAILTAIAGSGRMAGSDYRTQSGALVANTLLQALGKMTAR